MAKTILAIIAAIAAIAVCLVLAALWYGDKKLGRRVDVRVVPVAYAQPTPAVLKLGKYLFESRGCGECHGMDGAGRVMLDEPGGLFVRTPDITPSKASVVAAYSEADWVRAIRHGIDPAGRALLVMPSEDYNRMNDADFAALVAYMRSLPAGKGTIGEVRMPAFLRVLYAAGVFKDASEKIDHRLPPAAPIAVAETREHGGYVANMCMGCHGPGFAGGKIPGTPPDWPPASNLTPGEGSVMPRYAKVDDFVATMRTGKRPDGSAVSKVMPFESLKNMNDTDLRAMHFFLLALPPRKAGERVTTFERPHVGLADSYRAMVREILERGEDLIPFPLSYPNDDFPALVARLAADARGETIPAGFVPNSTFWLVDDAGEVVAVSNLRHALTDKLRIEGGHIGYGVRPSARRRGHATEILRRSLAEARALGIEEALVTCAATNTGSAGTILKCGGRLQSEEFVEPRGEVVRRYLIKT